MSADSVTVLQVTTVPQTLYRLFPPLLKFLRDKGYVLSAACSKGTQMKREKVEALLDMTIHEVPLSRTVSPLQDLVALFHLVRLMLREKPDIVHSHTPKAGLLGSLAAWLTRRPVRIYTVRGLPHLTATGLTRRMLLGCERIACACAHQVICVSDSVKASLVDEGACKPEKMLVPGAGSAQGVDTRGRYNPAREDLQGADVALREQLNIGGDAMVIGFVGRLTRDKGVRELSVAWRQIRDKYNLHLILLGAGNEPRSGMSEADFNIFHQDEKIHLVGVVEDIERYYCLFDLLVFPSYREGMPNAVLEASAMQVPVIAWDTVGSMDAIQEGRTGFLVPFQDADTLTARITQLLDDPEQRRTMGHAAREWVQTAFVPEDRFNQLDELYQTLLKKTGKHTNER